MKEGTLGVEEMQEFIRQTAIQFPTEKLKVKEKNSILPTLLSRSTEESNQSCLIITYLVFQALFLQ